MKSITPQALRITTLCVAVGLLGGCLSPGNRPSDTDQFKRMNAETPEARTEEAISCDSRDLLCARLVTLRGEACALTANRVGVPDGVRAKRRQCALADARAVPDLLPANAPAEDQENALLLTFDAWQAARSGDDPAATPAALDAAVAELRGRPGGRAYGDALAAANLTATVMRHSESKATECANLRQARQLLPNATAGSTLADRIDLLRNAIRSASSLRSCPA